MPVYLSRVTLNNCKMLHIFTTIDIFNYSNNSNNAFPAFLCITLTQINNSDVWKNTYTIITLRSHPTK